MVVSICSNMILWNLELIIINVADYKFAGNKRGLFTKMVSLDVFSQRLLSEGSGSYKRIARLLQQLEISKSKGAENHMAVSAKGEILRVATCQYIQDGHHIILKGASGNGNVIFYCSNENEQMPDKNES